MVRGIPRPADEWDVILEKRDLRDIDYTKDSNSLWSARGALILTASLDLVLWFFVGITLIFSISFGTDPAIHTPLWFGILSPLLDLIVLLTLPFLRLPFESWLLIFLAGGNALGQTIQLVARIGRIVRLPGCQISCGVFEYLFFAYSIFFFLLAIGYVIGSINYFFLVTEYNRQRKWIIDRFRESGSSVPTTTTPGNPTTSISLAHGGNALRRRNVGGKPNSNGWNMN